LPSSSRKSTFAKISSRKSNYLKKLPRHLSYVLPNPNLSITLDALSFVVGCSILMFPRGTTTLPGLVVPYTRVV
jgi:hypothetical protein